MLPNGEKWRLRQWARTPFPLALDDPGSVLAVKGTLRRFAPWTAPGRSEGMTWVLLSIRLPVPPRYGVRLLFSVLYL